jgi:hypothetical protein
MINSDYKFIIDELRSGLTCSDDILGSENEWRYAKACGCLEATINMVITRLERCHGN